MPDVSVDNTPVTVGLDDQETFTPASGTTIVATIQAAGGSDVNFTVSGEFVPGVAQASTSSAPAEVSVILTNDTEVKADGTNGALITGFVV